MSTSQSDTLTSERQEVLDLHMAGRSVREIASTLNVSTQRIYQQLKKLREDGFIEEEAS